MRTLGVAVWTLAIAMAQGAGEPLRNELITVSAGPFTMGSNDGPDDERPAHQINLAAFEIDRFPVTNAQFADFLSAHGTHNKAGERLYDHDDPDARVHQQGGRWAADRGYENHPVVEPTWVGARDYCLWRSKRLPTEAEWEKAARGTDGRKYPWGNSPADANRARYAMRYGDTSPVDGFPAGASSYGVLDMSGNAWEWISSAYRPYPFNANDGREDPKPGPVRATRGGGHDSPAAEISATYRGRSLSRNPASGHHNIGFRCAK